MSHSRELREEREQGISLLVRNLPHDCRPEEVRSRFEKYGQVRDVYLPRDYYTQRSKGFGFIEFRDRRDAEDAIHYLDRTTLGGREISVVMSKQSRKTPREMMRREAQEAGNYRRRGSPGRRSRSPSPRRKRSRSPYRRRSSSRDRSDRSGRENYDSRGAGKDWHSNGRSDKTGRERDRYDDEDDRHWKQHEGDRDGGRERYHDDDGYGRPEHRGGDPWHEADGRREVGDRQKTPELMEEMEDAAPAGRGAADDDEGGAGEGHGEERKRGGEDDDNAADEAEPGCEQVGVGDDALQRSTDNAEDEDAEL